MTAAVVLLAVALAGALGTIGYLAYRLMQITPELVAAGKATIAAAQTAETYREERDMAVADLAASRKQEAAAIVRLKLAEKQRNEAQEEATKRVVETIRSKATPIADASRLLDELLQAPILPTASKAGDTGADGSGA